MAIPVSWKQTELGEILLSIVGGGTPSKSIQSYYEGNIPWMSVKDMNKNILHDTVDHISEDAVKNSSTNVIPSGTPIVATRMSLGKIVVANFNAAINQDLKALFPASGVNREYLIGWYRSISRKIEELGTGTTVKGIRLEVLKSLEFPLPPPEEQKIIADKLEKLLAQVETTKARLERIPEILKTFRQSVLSAAVGGKLTEEWRAINGIREIKSVTWQDILADGKESFKRGPFGSALKKSMFVESGFKVYEQYCPINDDCSYARYYVTPEKFEEMKAFEVLDGDFLISCSGVSLGRITQVPPGSERGIINQALLRVRLNKAIYNDDYFKILFRSPTFQKAIFANSTGSAIPNLKSTKELKAMPVPLPDFNEQTETVRRVEDLFAFADSIEQKVNAALQRVNNLTQSILAKAFRGELTAEWRAANPELISGENSAEALLAKIKVEREALKPVKKGSVRKKS